MTPAPASHEEEDDDSAPLLALVRDGRFEEAEQGTRALLPRLHQPRARADLLFDVVLAMLTEGYQTALTADAVDALLSLADRHLAAGRRPAAARSFGRATRLAFHRTLHLHSVRSPLADDPEVFTAGFGTSTTAQAVRSPRGREAAAAAAPPPSVPTRVLVLTRENDNFLQEIRGHLGDADRVEVRFLDLAAGHEGLLEGVSAPQGMAREILTGERGLADRAEKALRPWLDWADVVLVEWCIAHAALVNLVDPRDTRVIVRLHSYEAFTAWPHLMDWSRVDDLLFVSEHVRDLALAAVPGLRGAGAPTLRVLPLGLQLRRFVRPKSAEARHHVGLVGWSVVAKDALWALEVIRGLSAVDPAYRLLLIGDEFDATKSTATETYGLRLDAELAELEAAGVVRRLGNTEDVPGALVDVGVILSASVRESFHAGLVEGAASGAVPVVRDWPFFARKPHGARTLFPDDWVVETPAEAVERIVRVTTAAASWQEAGSAASEHALGTWDWAVTRPGYEELFLGGGRPD